jgi:hypothetical protein
MFNMAMCYYKMGYSEWNKYLDGAKSKSVTQEHSRIIDPWLKKGKGNQLILFSVPLAELFRVPESKTKNLGKKTFLKDAKLIITSSTARESTGFIGFSGANTLNGVLETEGTLARRKNSDASLETFNSRSGTTLDRGDRSGTPTFERTSFASRSRRPSAASPSISQRGSSMSGGSIGRKVSSPEERKQGSRDPFSSALASEARKYTGRKNSEDSGYDESDTLIKIHIDSKTYKLKINPKIKLDDLLNDISEKFGININQVDLGYYEEDNQAQLISILDQEDLQLALQCSSSLCLSKSNVLDFY